MEVKRQKDKKINAIKFADRKKRNIKMIMNFAKEGSSHDIRTYRSGAYVSETVQTKENANVRKVTKPLLHQVPRLRMFAAVPPLPHLLS